MVTSKRCQNERNSYGKTIGIIRWCPVLPTLPVPSLCHMRVSRCGSECQVELEPRGPRLGHTRTLESGLLLQLRGSKQPVLANWSAQFRRPTRGSKIASFPPLGASFQWTRPFFLMTKATREQFSPEFSCGGRPLALTPTKAIFRASRDCVAMAFGSSLALNRRCVASGLETR